MGFNVTYPNLKADYKIPNIKIKKRPYSFYKLNKKCKLSVKANPVLLRDNIY